MIDIKFSKQRFKDHFYYSKWLYVAFIALGIVVFSLVYSISAPTVPGEYKIDISIMVSALDDTTSSDWEEELLSILPADQQEINIYSMGFSGEDSSLGYSVYEILAARIAAQEGDIYILTTEVFQTMMEQGAFLSLDDIVDNYEFSDDIDLDDYKATISEDDYGDGEEHIFGLPLADVYGMYDLAIDPSDYVIGILAYTENYDNCVLAVDFFMNKTVSEYYGDLLSDSDDTEEAEDTEETEETDD